MTTRFKIYSNDAQKFPKVTLQFNFSLRVFVFFHVCIHIYVRFEYSITLDIHNISVTATTRNV
jgi:hypothetical protein